MTDETIELQEVAEVLDGLSSPTDEELMQAVRGYSDGAVASAAAKLALSASPFETIGVVAETMPRPCATSGQGWSSGDYRFGLVALRAGQEIAGAVVGVASSSADPTVAKVGIYDALTLDLVAASASAHALAWDTYGTLAVDLTETFEVPTTGPYYAGLLFVASNVPSLGSTPNGVVGAGAGPEPGSTVWICGRQTGLADLPATLVPESGNVAYYVGLYE